MRAAVLIGVAALVCAMPSDGSAQVAPNLRWRTIESEHFYVHFSPRLESMARLSIAYAESAYTKLSGDLKAPRGRIDIVVADNRDFANGYASAFPTNRIVVYTMPPLDVPMLRSTENWLESVVTHELVHIFHLDRAEGLWRAAQWIFGRNPSMLPNNYAPSWIKEGLAVYYESKLTSEGRLRSGEQHMLVRAAAEHGALPPIGSMSLATSRPPEGHTPYVFGSRLIQYLAERGPAGERTMDKFVGSMSATIVPFLYSSAAKKAFGLTFGEAWGQYGDSIKRAYGTRAAPLPEWRVLTSEGRVTWYPRWRTDSSLLFVGNSGRETSALYSLTLDGETRRVARRNAVAAFGVAPDGGMVFAQPEYIDPYTIRFDLYRRTPSGKETRLTHGARLTAPDVRADGEIVAVQVADGATALVRVSPNGRSITPLADSDSNVYWADPRWSPDGKQIAAVRRLRDGSGSSSIVVFGEAGARLNIAEGEPLKSSPAWIDSSRLLFHVDSGRSQIALVDLSTPTMAHTITRASTGVLHPAPSPNARLLAAVEYRYDGYHIGVAPLDLRPVLLEPLPPVTFGSFGGITGPGSASARGSQAPGEVASPPASGSVARRYSAWRHMIPRYWAPLAATGENESILVGGSTSAEDVIDRHAYTAELLVNTGNGVVDASFEYSYAGLGMPVVSLSARQSNGYSPVFAAQPRERIGFVREQSRIGAVSLQFRRPRYRNSASFTIGAEYERRTYDSDPADLLTRLDDFNSTPREFYAVATGITWSNTQRPSLSISPEDGVSLSLSLRERWRVGGSSTPAATAIGSMRLFKSLDLPGFAHHVLAGRVALGVANSHATSRFGVGGKSGSKLELFPGYSIGDAARSFPVRGFDASTLVGLRAATASLEYRLPVAMPARGLGMFPLFFDRVSLSFFGDAGAAWCPGSYAELSICNEIPARPGDNLIASAGAELNLDSALQYDVPYRLRVGFAGVLHRPAGLETRGGEVYFTLGFPF